MRFFDYSKTREAAAKWSEMFVGAQKAKIEREQAAYITRCVLLVISALCLLIFLAKL